MYKRQLVSPTIFEEFMMPYYKKVVAYFKEMGVKAVFVDSDGNVEQLLPLFIEAGVDGIYPCEVQSGSDPVEPVSYTHLYFQSL